MKKRDIESALRDGAQVYALTVYEGGRRTRRDWVCGRALLATLDGCDRDWHCPEVAADAEGDLEWTVVDAADPSPPPAARLLPQGAPGDADLAGRNPLRVPDVAPANRPGREAAA